MAGLDGIRNQYETPVSMDEGTEENDTTERLPRTLHEAVKYFKEDEFLQEALGKHISHHLIVTKDAEWDEYCKQVTKWEKERYLGTV